MIRRLVIRVIDGDTFITRRPVNGSKYIRIANVYAPDRGEYGYYAAKNSLKRRLEEKSVQIDSAGKSYNRTKTSVVKNDRKVYPPRKKYNIKL